jgi:hypothetical protein
MPYDSDAFQNATALFFKLSNTYIDTTIDTNLLVEFNQRIENYNYKNYHTILVHKDSYYYYVNETYKKNISIDEIMIICQN